MFLAKISLMNVRLFHLTGKEKEEGEELKKATNSGGFVGLMFHLKKETHFLCV